VRDLRATGEGLGVAWVELQGARVGEPCRDADALHLPEGAVEVGSSWLVELRHEGQGSHVAYSIGAAHEDVAGQVADLERQLGRSPVVVQRALVVFLRQPAVGQHHAAARMIRAHFHNRRRGLQRCLRSAQAGEQRRPPCGGLQVPGLQVQRAFAGLQRLLPASELLERNRERGPDLSGLPAPKRRAVVRDRQVGTAEPCVQGAAVPMEAARRGGERDRSLDRRQGRVELVEGLQDR
jgi:hypothetical protein